MLVDLTPIIRHGIIDNTTQGAIRLLLWCVGESAPIPLEMPGNCLQDIAGCRVKFQLRDRSSEAAPPQELLDLVRSLGQQQEPLIAGDMTLSRRYPTPPHPKRLANILSLEFFQGAKMRFIIEDENFEYETGLPEWACSTAAAGAQELTNMAAMHDHVLANVADFRGPSLMHLGTAEMPSCRWDYLLNRAEAYMILVPFIHAKYAGRPNAHIAEAFVLDCMEYLNQAAGRVEQGSSPGSLPRPHWEVLDFMEPAHARLARLSMRHPLFGAAAQLSQIIRERIIAKLSQYKGNEKIETLLTHYSGIISHVLATIMLTREGKAHLGAITSRAESLCERMQQLLCYGEAILPKDRPPFIKGAEEVLARLKEFLCTLRQ